MHLIGIIIVGTMVSDGKWNSKWLSRDVSGVGALVIPLGQPANRVVDLGGQPRAQVVQSRERVGSTMSRTTCSGSWSSEILCYLPRELASQPETLQAGLAIQLGDLVDQAADNAFLPAGLVAQAQGLAVEAKGVDNGGGLGARMGSCKHTILITSD